LRRHFSGFIEFIVDPSFQVMADAIDRIIEPTQQQQTQVQQQKPGKQNGSDKQAIGEYSHEIFSSYTAVVKSTVAPSSIEKTLCRRGMRMLGRSEKQVCGKWLIRMDYQYFLLAMGSVVSLMSS
jgi:hypothetical protein